MVIPMFAFADPPPNKAYYADFEMLTDIINCQCAVSEMEVVLPTEDIVLAMAAGQNETVIENVTSHRSEIPYKIPEVGWRSQQKK